MNTQIAAASVSTDLFVTAGTTGTGAATSISGSVATETKMHQLSGLGVDATGNVLIADRADSQIVLLARSAANPGYSLGGTWHAGDLYTLAGDAFGVPANPSSGTVGLLTKLDLPNSVASDPEGNVVFADSGDNEVDVLAENPEVPPYDLNGASWTVGDLYVLAGGGATVPSSAGSPAVGSSLDQPDGVAVSSGGNVTGDIVISDTAHNEIELLAVSFVNPGFSALPPALTPGDLYVIAGAAPTTLPDACGVLAESATLNGPEDTVIDGLGNLVSSDSGNNEVEVTARSATNPGYVLGSGAVWRAGYNYVLEGSGPHSNGSTCPLSQAVPLNDPHAVALDPEGDVLVADTSNQRIRVLATSLTNPGYDVVGGWAPGSSYVLVGSGPSLPTTSGTSGAATSLTEPEGIADASDGQVFVADAGTSEVDNLLIAPAPLSAPLVVAGDGDAAISWSQPATAGGSTVTSYRVDVYVGSSAVAAVSIDTGSTATTYEVTGLADGTTYGFDVAAKNSIGMGVPSPEVTVTPTSGSPPPTATPPQLTSPPPDDQPSDSSTSAATATSLPNAQSTVPPGLTTPRPTKVAPTKALKPAIRLAAPDAAVGANGAVLQLSCVDHCKGVLELTETAAVGLGIRRVVETEVLAATTYRLKASKAALVHVPLTSAGRSLLKTLHQPLVVDETLTVSGGKTVSGRIRLLPPKPTKAKVSKR
jgi:hypothetical protein